MLVPFGYWETGFPGVGLRWIVDWSNVHVECSDSRLWDVLFFSRFFIIYFCWWRCVSHFVQKEVFVWVVERYRCSIEARRRAVCFPSASPVKWKYVFPRVAMKVSPWDCCAFSREHTSELEFLGGVCPRLFVSFFKNVEGALLEISTC